MSEATILAVWIALGLLIAFCSKEATAPYDQPFFAFDEDDIGAEEEWHLSTLVASAVFYAVYFLLLVPALFVADTVDWLRSLLNGRRHTWS